jgi:hypothetical protein
MSFAAASSTTSPTKSLNNYICTPDTTLDCPLENCDGFMVIYRHRDTNEPAQVKCSNDKAKDPTKRRCYQRFMFSKFKSPCIACGSDIMEKEIIGLNTKDKWVHIICLDINFPRTFQNCLRCREPIVSETDAEPSNLGPIDGFIHIKCRKNKKPAYEAPVEVTPNAKRRAIEKLNSTCSTSSVEK